MKASVSPHFLALYHLLRRENVTIAGPAGEMPDGLCVSVFSDRSSQQGSCSKHPRLDYNNIQLSSLADTAGLLSFRSRSKECVGGGKPVGDGYVVYCLTGLVFLVMKKQCIVPEVMCFN